MNARTDGMNLSTKSLRKWYEWFKERNHYEYRIPELIQSLNDDVLDVDAIEEEVGEEMSRIRVTEGLCDECRSLCCPLLDDVFDYSDMSNCLMDLDTITKSFHRNTCALEASRNNGCRLCSLLIQSLIDKEGLLDTFRKIERRLTLLNKSAVLQVSFTLWASEHEKFVWLNFPDKLCTFYDWSPSYIIATASRTFDSRCGGPLSAPVFNPLDVAKVWLSTCLSNHRHCHVNNAKFLPTRLLAIDPPKLVITHDLMKEADYATLSHCWGTHDFFTADTQNFSSLLRSIPMEKLSKTFQDAFRITYRLGLKYIWIDSLCIIQDDHSDWQRESTTMSAIYSHSTINIAASDAKDGREGCFMKPKHFIGGLEVETDANGYRSRRTLELRDTYDKVVRFSVLATRGWALQEKLLPSRTLHCGRQGFFWECNTAIASEFFPHGRRGRKGEFMICGRHGLLRDSWGQIVIDYANCNLSFSKDKLVAISGIARKVQTESGDEYLAGLWRHGIEVQLCWSRKTANGSATMRPQQYQAPTWSWASIEGAICYSENEINEWQYQICVLDANVELTGDDPFGQVCGGSIIVAYSAVVCGRLVNDEGENWHADGFLSSPGRLEVDLGQRQHLLEFKCDCILPSPKDLLGVVYMLPFKFNNKGAIGLVLQATGDVPGEYRRIGYFEYHKFHAGENSNDIFQKALKFQGLTTAVSACAEVIIDVNRFPKAFRSCAKKISTTWFTLTII